MGLSRRPKNCISKKYQRTLCCCSGPHGLASTYGDSGQINILPPLSWGNKGGEKRGGEERRGKGGGEERKEMCQWLSGEGTPALLLMFLVISARVVV